MKIIADENIAGLVEYFAPFGQLHCKPGRSITTDDVKEADVLLVRSVTPVTEQLLNGSAVRFVGSCTIGIDHLDTDYLDSQNITWAYAPGCNAKAVADYVLACLLALKVDLSNSTVGIVGCGNVGGLVGMMLAGLNTNVLTCDPFLEDTDNFTHTPIEDLIPQCDAVCLHTPLTESGSYPTHHLINKNNLSLFKSNAVLLNAGRGAVIDNGDLAKWLTTNKYLQVVLDVWENEPDILIPLLEQVKIATPHIAGYSLGGKWRGTENIFKEFCQFISVSDDKKNNGLSRVHENNNNFYINLNIDELLNHYNPFNDTKALKEILMEDNTESRKNIFDGLRTNYCLRKEFNLTN